MAKQRSELGDLGNEYDEQEEAVVESIQYMNDTIMQWPTTAMVTIVGARDRFHNEISYMEEAIHTVHLLSGCIHEEEHYRKADDDEFGEVHKEE